MSTTIRFKTFIKFATNEGVFVRVTQQWQASVEVYTWILDEVSILRLLKSREECSRLLLSRFSSSRASTSARRLMMEALLPPPLAKKTSD